MSANAFNHLSKDKKLATIISKIGTLELKENFDLYRSLLAAIVSQQLSTKAANTINARASNLEKRTSRCFNLLLEVVSSFTSFRNLTFVKSIFLNLLKLKRWIIIGTARNKSEKRNSG